MDDNEYIKATPTYSRTVTVRQTVSDPRLEDVLKDMVNKRIGDLLDASLYAAYGLTPPTPQRVEPRFDVESSARVIE